MTLHHAMWRNVMSIGVFWGYCSIRTKTLEKNNLAQNTSGHLLFYKFISKLFASHSTLCQLSMMQRSWENLYYTKLRSTSAVSIEVSKFSNAKNFLGICFTLVNDHTQQVSAFAIFANFGPFLAVFGPMKASFPHQIQQNWEVAEFK